MDKKTLGIFSSTPNIPVDTGIGTQTFPDGSAYTGQLKDGLMHGKGILTFSDGSTYSGDFKNNLYNGEGILRQIDGTILNGMWKDGELIKKYPLMSLTDEVKQMAFENQFKKLTPEEIDNLYKIKKLPGSEIPENPFISMVKDMDETKNPDLNFYTKYLKYKKKYLELKSKL